MTLEPELKQSSLKERSNQLRQLEHDLNTYLGVVSTGMQALAGTRDEPDKFARLQTMIEEEGITPLKQMVAKIISVALEE